MKHKSLSGVIVIDKPQGLSSTETLERVKKILKVKKAGHGGTLDPLATGVLPIFLNEATKIAQIFLDGDKVYEGEFELGLTTDTYDITGEVLSRREVKDITLEQLKELSQKFVGELEQIPPPYSAAKYRGRPLYKYARNGLIIPKNPKKVKIYTFEIKTYHPPKATFYLVCSKGTYVRSIVHNLGELLGCGACLTSLRRLQKSIFKIENSISLEELERLTRESRISEKIIPLNEVLEFLPKIIISKEFSQRVRLGVQINRSSFLSIVKFQKLSLSPSEKWLRLVDTEGKLVAIIENPILQKEKSYIQYLRVFKNGS